MISAPIDINTQASAAKLNLGTLSHLLDKSAKDPFADLKADHLPQRGPATAPRRIAPDKKVVPPSLSHLDTKLVSEPLRGLRKESELVNATNFVDGLKSLPFGFQLGCDNLSLVASEGVDEIGLAVSKVAESSELALLLLLGHVHGPGGIIGLLGKLLLGNEILDLIVDVLWGGKMRAWSAEPNGGNLVVGLVDLKHTSGIVQTAFSHFKSDGSARSGPQTIGFAGLTVFFTVGALATLVPFVSILS